MSLERDIGTAQKSFNVVERNLNFVLQRMVTN